jgi:Homeodomain-like domain
MRRCGKSKPVVWTWQARFMAEGVEGLLRDKTRKPGKPPLPPNTVQRVVDLALGPPPGERTHWTGRELAKAAGVSLRSVQRILEAHQLAPPRIRTFRPYRARFADEEGPRRDDDPRLQTPWHNDAVRRPHVLDGTVIGRNMQRHRPQEFIRFLNTAEAQVPVRMAIHAVVDNYATHKLPRYKNGWPGIPAGRSTSRLPRRPGSTPSKASSPNSRDGASSVE